MPQVPVIIPVIVTGLVVGWAMKSKTRRISKKRLMSASLLAGALNVAYVYLLQLLMPEVFSLGFSSRPSQAASQLQVPATSELVFMVSCFLTGFLIVLVVLGIAMVYARTRKGEELAEVPELTSEEESTLRPG
jgi:H+/Cl- antiporter ClcA